VDDDRAQDTPVRLAGVEQGSDPVVPEVAESEARLIRLIWLLSNSVGVRHRVDSR
jgi:hypothetical protein